MKKVMRILATALTAALLLSATACTSTTAGTSAAAGTTAATTAAATTAAATTADSGKTYRVGVAMPTQSSERWIADGANVKKQLEALGYVVDLQYAEDDVQAQVNQIENMITNGANCLVIAAIDSSALVNILAKAKSSSIPVIAYDRLLMNTDAVSYYATFDNYQVGVLQASYLVDALGLKDSTKGPFNVELFAGSPDDNNATLFWNGAMDTLKPYIDSKQIVVLSGQTKFEECATLRWAQEVAQARMENILSGTYSGGAKVNAVLSPYDGISYGIAAALEGAGYKVGTGWPLITGQDAELMGVKNLISGKQAMTVFKDTRVLASKCVKMVDAVLKGTTPEINDTKTYNNGVLVVPSYLCTPVAVTKDNYVKEVIDSGYYTADQVAG